MNRELSSPGMSVSGHIQQTSVETAKGNINDSKLIEHKQLQIVESAALNNVVGNLPLLVKGENKTDTAISNADFMVGVFGDIVGNDRPIVVSFAGNPSRIGKNSWFGRPWVVDKTPLSEEHNNYTSFAVFKPDNEGKYRLLTVEHTRLYMANMIRGLPSKLIAIIL